MKKWDGNFRKGRPTEKQYYDYHARMQEQFRQGMVERGLSEAQIKKKMPTFGTYEEAQKIWDALENTGSPKPTRPPISEEELREYYQVKFTLDGKLRYGVVYAYDSETKEAAKQGFLLVEDCELPTSYKHVPALVEKVDSDDWDKVHQWLEDRYDEAARKAIKSKTLKHQILRFGVADGSAHYVVTSASKTHVTVEWRGWGGLDRYVDRMLGWGGRVPRRMIEGQIESKEWLKKSIEFNDDRERRKKEKVCSES